MINVTATITAKRDKVDDVLNALKFVKSETEKEVGCYEYKIHQLADDATQIFFYERWESLEHLNKHAVSKHFTDFAAQADALLDKSFEIKIYKEVL